jgi:hypothetical protein
MVNDEACFLREATGTSAEAETARAVAAALARSDIAHLIAGGLAVQESLETWDALQAEK